MYRCLPSTTVGHSDFGVWKAIAATRIQTIRVRVTDVFANNKIFTFGILVGGLGVMSDAASSAPKARTCMHLPPLRNCLERVRICPRARTRILRI